MTENEMKAYIMGYNKAIDLACDVLERAVIYRRSIFGRHEERIFDNDFIKKFREVTKIKE